MLLRNTANSIQVEVGILYKNLTGRPQLTAAECDIVQGAIVDAFQFVLLEYGVESFKFNESSVTVSTVANQGYVDLTEYVYRVVPGTVRIPAQDTYLGLIDEAKIYQLDPNADQKGLPESYAYVASADPDVIRLGLWPIPDAVYSMSMNVLTYPADSIDSFPAALNTAIKLKAKSMACLGLGMTALMPGFERAYEDIMAKLKDSYNDNGPKHVGMRLALPITRSIEGRIAE